MKFSVQYHRHGRLMSRFTVDGVECGLVGAYVNGIPYLPSDSQVREGLPYSVRKAFDRASKWWGPVYANHVYCDLVSLDGKPLGTVRAELVESEE